MSDRIDPPGEIRDLFDAYCDDVIDEEHLRRLEGYLLADEAVRREFVAYFHLHTELHFAIRARRAAYSVLRLINEGSRRRSTGSWNWRVATAAAVLLVGLGALLFARGRREIPTGARPTPAVTIANGLAMVVRLDGVQWEADNAPHPSEGDLLAAGHLRFRSGRATLSMLTGVSLVVEGPADVEIVSSEKVLCHRGKLRARVPEGVDGLVVSGPGSAVVDLGTEFGMNVEGDGRTRAKVFEGLVEAALLSQAGSYQRRRMMDRRSDTFEIDPRTGRIGSDAGPSDFVAPFKPAAPHLVLDAGYRDAVLRSGPWGYWRFESLADGLIPNEVPGRPPLRANGPIRLSDPARGNKSAVFGAGQPGQYLTPDGTWQPGRHPGYAVELWFLPEGISHAMLVSMLTDDPRALPAKQPSDFHFKFHLELTSRTRTQLLHQPASVRFLHRYPPGWYQSSDNLYSDKHYVPYRWHHVVGQMNEDRMELFLDGQRTPPLSVDPAYTNEPCQLLLGQVTTIPAHKNDMNRPFVGLMDEVALYDRPLAIEEIRQHHRLGRPEGPAEMGGASGRGGRAGVSPGAD